MSTFQWEFENPGQGRRYMLKEDAIPTLFEPAPACLAKKAFPKPSVFVIKTEQPNESNPQTSCEQTEPNSSAPSHVTPTLISNIEAQACPQVTPTLLSNVVVKTEELDECAAEELLDIHETLLPDLSDTGQTVLSSSNLSETTANHLSSKGRSKKSK